MKIKGALIPLITIFFVLLLSFLLKNNSAAAILEKVNNRTYVVTDDYLDVTETKITKVLQNGYLVPLGSQEAFTIFYPIEGDPVAQDKIQKTLDSILITDTVGNKLEYTYEETPNKNLIVKVSFPEAISSRNPQTITLKYKAYGLLVKSGAIRDIYIPGFPENYQLDDNNSTEQINTKVVIPKSIGIVNFSLPESEIISEGENSILNISFEKLKGKTNWIQIGTKQYYRFEFKQKMPASSKIPFMLNTVKMPLPRDIQSGPVTQTVYYKNISPAPFSIELDKDKNLIAVFKIPANQESEIKITGFATLEQDQNFDIKNAGKTSQIPANILLNNTTEAKYWETTASEIQKVADELKGDSTDVYEIINNTYNYVINKIDYSFVKKYGINNRQGALATLQGGAAVCMEYSDLFITLLRAQEIPARAAFGYGFSSLDYESQDENRINHQWAEVYLPAQDLWINVDTTWGDFGNGLLGGDLNHFYSHVASIDPETPSTTEVSFFGTIEQIPERDMNIYVTEAIDSVELKSATQQKELLEEYKSKTGASGILQNIQFSFLAFNANIDNTIENLTGLNSQSALLAIKLIVPILSLLLIALLIYLSKRVKFK